MVDLTIHSCWCCEHLFEDALGESRCTWIEEYSDKEVVEVDGERQCPECGGPVTVYRYGA